jgi:type III restriction enzyme
MSLREDYDALSRRGYIPKQIPEFIKDNLNPEFELREYQKEAIARFMHYCDDPQRLWPSQLLFHMATGSGKTLLMAADILYLFKQGYRNFLFFVNSTNIIEKTRDNFLNKRSSKFLFNQKISFDGKESQVKEVSNFEVIDPDGMNIFFTTIQGLHSLMSAHRENILTYEDFRDKKIVIISDEAHHINAWTKSGLSKTEDEAKNTWEHTVTSLFNLNKNNIMLEYTATVNLSEPAIRDKYFNKIIYEYTLRNFRIDGFSKEVKVMQADLKPIDRALQAVIISQYRRKIADNVKRQIKPIILMKSKTISESEEFKGEFDEKIRKLKADDLEKIRSNIREENVLKKAFEFFEKEKITHVNLISEIKEEFGKNKCLLLDSNNITEENQLIVNKLEDKNNEIRVIFAVNMLNEGWDVLNLFDIVRLYNTRDAKANRPGPTTIAEAQLIGRGARYFPFKVSEDQDKYRRKYDNEIDDDLRVLEELYYHSAHNPRYIQELTIALKETGIIPPSEPKRIDIRVKDSFKKTDFWKNGFIFLNEKKQNDISKVKNLEDIDVNRIYKYGLLTGFVKSITVFESDEKRKTDFKTSETLRLDQFDKKVIRKAIDKLDFYKFNNLKKYFPAMNSINEFIMSTSDLRVEVSSSKDKLDNLTTDDKLEVAIFVLDKIKNEIERTYTEYKGTKIFKPMRISEVVEDRTINIVVNENLTSDQEKGIAMKEARNSDLRTDLSNQNWYVYDENYGTSEEKYLICFIRNMMNKLQEKYSDVYLLRNESLFKIYHFSDAKPIEPDFVLFLKERQTEKILLYQLFIESKGDGLLVQDKWKENMLKEIESNYSIQTFAENQNLKIIGMPFYNERTKSVFIDEFNGKLRFA